MNYIELYLIEKISVQTKPRVDVTFELQENEKIRLEQITVSQKLLQ